MSRWCAEYSFALVNIALHSLEILDMMKTLLSENGCLRSFCRNLTWHDRDESEKKECNALRSVFITFSEAHNASTTKCWYFSITSYFVLKYFKTYLRKYINDSAKLYHTLHSKTLRCLSIYILVTEQKLRLILYLRASKHTYGNK